MESNILEIQEAFSRQAAIFNSYQNNVFKNAFSEKMIRTMDLSEKDNVLETAAGTCGLGRMIAPLVRHIVELDVTEKMLAEGKRANDDAGIMNAEYKLANAETLPFEDECFDAAVTRLSFHHFKNPDQILREMVRVLKIGGKIGIIDMIPPDEKSRDRFDRIEFLRDPSHVHCFTPDELQTMLQKNGLRITAAESNIIPMDLASWMRLTDTDDSVQKEIRDALIEDLSGGESSGMSPFLEEGVIKFHRHWVYIVAQKL